MGGMTTSMGGSGSTPPPNVVNTATCVPPKLKLSRIVTADSPMALAQATGDPRMFVVERAGLIRIKRGGTFASAPFMDIRKNVLNAARITTHERGLLNMVLHPDFSKTGRFFIFYNRRADDALSAGSTKAEGAIVVAEGQQDGSTDRAKATLKILTTVDVPDDHHIGGFMGFGPEGLLYVGVGDGGGGWDKSAAGQDPRRRLAKILRIDVDNPTTKPTGNLEMAGADPLTWAYGIRNPFRGSFDSANGDLYIGDVGEQSWEEINWIPRGKSQLNFGWGFRYPSTMGPDASQPQSGMEGMHPFPWFTGAAWKPIGYLPVYEMQHSGAGWATNPDSYQGLGGACRDGEGPCSRAIIGGRVYRGKAMKDLYGRYIFGEHMQNMVKSFIIKDGKVTCEADLTTDLVNTQNRLQGINGFGVDGDGEMYIHDLAAGNIYKIEAE